MTDDEKGQVEKHRRLIDVMAVLMLASMGSWQNETAGHFKEYLDGSFQIAWWYVMRGSVEDARIVEEAEQLIAKRELLATIKQGGKVQ